jgi:hypothetical protein
VKLFSTADDRADWIGDGKEYLADEESPLLWNDDPRTRGDEASTASIPHFS